MAITMIKGIPQVALQHVKLCDILVHLEAFFLWL